MRKALKEQLKSAIDPVIARLSLADGSKLAGCELSRLLSSEIRAFLQENFIKAHDSAYFLMLRRSLKSGDEDAKELFSEVFLPLFKQIQKLLNEHAGAGSEKRNRLRSFLIIDGVFGVLRDFEFLSVAPGATGDLIEDTALLSEMIGSLALNG